MRLSIWLGGLALCAAVACGDDSSDDGDGPSPEVSRAVAEALTEGIQFENGLLRTGSIPEASAETVSLSQDDDVVQLAPGDTSLMSLGVENPDADDPVESTLIQFGDSDDHVEIPAGGGDGGTGDGGTPDGEVALSFMVDGDVCDAFCNEVFTIQMLQAVRMASGAVSRHLVRTIELDCREDGDEALCDENEPSGDPDAGTAGEGGSGGSAGAGGGGSTTTARELGSAIAQVNLTACQCDMPSATNPYCATAPYPMDDVVCLTDAVGSDDALSGPASCLEMMLASAASTCSCTDTACFAGAIDTALGGCTNTAALDMALMDCNIGGASTARDAGP